ncbi:MAG: DUF2490 domain-containing protein [Bacteroidia bacterium]|nr:DUF2490 domain-containing protein [Bacteroidia bacterium]
MSIGINNKWNAGIYYFTSHPLVNLSAKKQHSPLPDILLFYGEHAVGCQVHPHLNLGAAYVFQRENVLDDYPFEENRIHLQAIFNTDKEKVFVFNFRIREDLRFIRRNLANAPVSFKPRIRTLAGISRKTSKGSAFTAYQEFFFNHAKNHPLDFAENWTYAGYAFPLKANTFLEAGLLFITWKYNDKNWFHQPYLQITYKQTL